MVEYTPELHDLYVKYLLTFQNEMETVSHYHGEWRLVDELMILNKAVSEADLTDRQRDVLRLMFRESLTQKETADALGCSQRTISFHLTAAIRKIAQLFEEWKVLT